jgi:transposase, IS5 family
LRHGLNVCVVADPLLVAAVELMARKIAGSDADIETLELARRIAEAQVDLTAYRSAKNEAMLARRGFVSRIHRKKPPGRPVPERMRIANAQKSKVRSAVEHVFAHQKGPMGLIVRTIGIARAKVKIGMANLAYNIRRFVWLRTKCQAA